MSLGKEIMHEVGAGADFKLDQAQRGVRDEYPDLGSLEIVADIASTISGFPNPISHILDIVDQLTEGRTSLWDDLQGKVQGEIAKALSTFLKTQVDYKLKLYK